MRTVSLRRRVTVLVLVVLASALLVSGIAVDAVFGVQSDRSLTALLDGRAQLARQLARQGVAPTALIRRVQTEGVQASLVLADGTTIGDTPPPQESIRTVRAKLVGTGRINGAQLTLTIDTSVVERSHRTLRFVLLIAGAGALLAAGLAVAFGTRVALAPLDAMTSLARSIAAGRRGDRLHVDRSDTELGRTAQAFDDMLDELEAAEARQRQFVADAAHELRTPISGIRAAADVLRGGGGDAAQRQRLQELMIVEADRAAGLVEDLLESARLDEGSPLRADHVDLRAVVQRELDAAAGAGIGTDLTGTAVDVRADGQRLAALIRNLVVNATHALASTPDPFVQVDIATSATGVVLTVTDNGPGVPATDRERVFDRLVRLDDGRARRSGGSGLGLAIARSTARRHGGDLVCTARQDGRAGARFVLTLPADTILGG
ncbi:MAG TPA: HAMP domain-containing sensor histidine kinase [Actinopolymorphaceae bacterium]|jgi:signal transduction histidine kinase